MEVSCEICKKWKHPDECWCVIDVKQKIRYFECRENCRPPTPIQRHEPAPVSHMETFELDISDSEEDEEPSETVLVEDWIVQPKRSWIQWMKDLIGIQTYRYVKVKTS